MIQITLDKLKKLQNGSDIRGIAIDGVPGEAQNLSEAEARLLTYGFMKWLSAKIGKQASELTISIGRDPRLSGEALATAASGVLCENGVRVLDCGLASTPAMFMSTVFSEYACDGAIMITASHLPYNRNGFKYFTAGGGLEKADIRALIETAYESFEYGEVSPQAPEKTGPACGDENACGLSKKPRQAEKCDLMDRYSAHLRRLIVAGVQGQKVPDVNGPATSDEPVLAGLHIVVDAGNGAGGFYASKVLAPLGADVTGSLYLDPDGHFPNHAPNPENAEAMHAISTAVAAQHADLGIIFDTDVDRSAAVDDQAREIARNGIVAMAAALIADQHPGSTVVTDSITSDQLAVFLEDRLGMKHLRFKRGYRNVINRSIELNASGVDSQLAIETSGHAAYKENYFLDDGAYLATKIVIKTAQLHAAGQAISSVIADLEEPLEAREVRFPIAGENFGEVGDRVITELQAFVQSFAAGAGAAGHGAADSADGPALSLVEPNFEGVRIRFNRGHGDGWCLLRKSLHDPIMPLNLESNVEGGVAIMAGILREFLAKYPELDISKL